MSSLIYAKDLNFLLYQVFEAEQLTELNRYKEHDKTTFDSILNTAQGIATDYFAPHNAKADQNEPIFDGTNVKTIPEVKLYGNNMLLQVYCLRSMIMSMVGCNFPL